MEGMDKASDYIDVVPHVGTWIEIWIPAQDRRCTVSFPTWERGLKSLLLQAPDELLIVVPHVGTWIEIRANSDDFMRVPGRSPRGNVD